MLRIRPSRSLAALGLAVAAAVVTVPVGAGTAVAATSTACAGGGFTVTLPSGKPAGDKVAAKDLAGGRLTVTGRYVTFTVDPATLGTYDYALTGAATPRDITGGVRTPVFASKVPTLPTPLSGELVVKNDRGDLLLLRRGGETKMKIQAKDCAQGGVFQMEPESTAAVTIKHVLAPGMHYYVNPYTQKVNLGNGTRFRGKDSAQVATKLSQTETVTTWSVAPGGRLGGVLGEDAVELSAGPTDCTSDCQARNRIRGSLPVTDPAFSG